MSWRFVLSLSLSLSPSLSLYRSSEPRHGGLLCNLLELGVSFLNLLQICYVKNPDYLFIKYVNSNDMSPRRTKLSHLQHLTIVKVKPSSWKRRRWKRNVSFVTLVLSPLQLCCPTCGKYMTTPVCTVILSATTVRTSSLSFIILNYGSGVFCLTPLPHIPHASSTPYLTGGF